MKKKLNYTRTSNSPYPAGSKEDMDLSMAYTARAKRNRAALAQGAKDVISGRAALEGAKVLGRGVGKGAKAVYDATLGNALKVEKRHMKINGYEEFKKRMNKARSR